jgi:hypothetical protein
MDISCKICDEKIWLSKMKQYPWFFDFEKWIFLAN